MEIRRRVYELCTKTRHGTSEYFDALVEIYFSKERTIAFTDRRGLRRFVQENEQRAIFLSIVIGSSFPQMRTRYSETK
jgi:hypothetical protein